MIDINVRCILRICFCFIYSDFVCQCGSVSIKEPCENAVPLTVFANPRYREFTVFVHCYGRSLHLAGSNIDLEFIAKGIPGFIVDLSPDTFLPR